MYSIQMNGVNQEKNDKQKEQIKQKQDIRWQKQIQKYTHTIQKN